MLQVAASPQENNSMNNDSALDMDVHDINPVALERALRSASLDLQQIIATVAGRHLDSGRRRYSSSAQLPTWRTLSPAASSSAMWSMKTSGVVSALARQSSGRRLRSQNMQALVSGGTWAV